MNFEGILEQCEVALIELEYASADFLHQKSFALSSLAASDLETLRAKLAAANLALQIALDILREGPKVSVDAHPGKTSVG
jgi:hypothetical protein